MLSLVHSRVLVDQRVKALGQCSHFIERQLPLVTLHNTPSTAAAAEAVANDEKQCQAAICSAICIQLFPDLEIKYKGIQNDQSTTLTCFNL
jgi:prephenate dehydratase